MPRRRARTALLLTHAGDTWVPDVVAAACEARGARVHRVDTDHLPGRDRLTFEDAGDGSWSGVLEASGEEIDLARVDAIWCRRIWTGAAGVDVDPRWSASCVAQANDALMGALAALAASGCRVINRPDAQLAAERKLAQLPAARAAGLAVPPTLVTNDAAAARAFVAAHGPCVAKMLVPLSQTMDGSGPFMYTGALDGDDLRAPDLTRALAAAPMIFQRKVEKVREARVIVVGARAFCGTIDIDADAPLDWRTGGAGVWRATEPPPAVARASIAACRALDLVTGALDFVVDADGRWWFLEVNPAGEWGWLQRDCGLKIAEAIAAELLP